MDYYPDYSLIDSHAYAEPKSVFVYVGLWLLLGSLGIHNMYLGEKSTGLRQFFTFAFVLLCLMASVKIAILVYGALQLWLIVDLIINLATKRWS
jgi:TM2 domain-containing membrane protein YozV